MSGEILVARDGPVATVTLSNPPKLNALTVAMWRALAAAFGELSAKQVGQAEGNEEGVGNRPGAQHVGHEDVAHEAQEARG